MSIYHFLIKDNKEDFSANKHSDMNNAYLFYIWIYHVILWKKNIYLIYKNESFLN